MTPTASRSALFCAFALSLSLAGCQRAGGSAAAEGEPLAVGKAATGEITSANRLNYGDGTRTALFSFELEAGEAVAIEAGASFCGRLALYTLEADGRHVLQGAASESECVEKDGRQVQMRSRLSAEGGRYLVAFSGRTPADFGPYRVALESLEVQEDRDLVAGDNVTGVLEESKTIALKIAEAGRYQIDLRSGEFDPTLALEGQGVSRENDDAGESMDSRLTTYLAAGDYRLTLGRVGDEGGLYRLSVQQLESSPPDGVALQNEGALTPGTPLTGMLQGESATYQLVLPERSRVELSMASDDFDTRIDLAGEGLALSDDDSGDDTDSRLVTVLEAGSYTVTAVDLADDNSGVFTLSAKVEPATGPVPALVPGAPQSDSLAAGEQRRYRLSVPEAASYVLTMQSSDLDSVLNVLRDGEVVGSDDDGGNDTDARLEIDLEPGDYEVVAITFGGDSGRFRIEASVR